MKIVCSISTVLLTSLAGAAFGGVLILGPGSELDTGSGSVGLGCADLEVHSELRGTVRAAGHVSIEAGGSVQSELLEFSGNWTNRGSPATNGLVHWNEGCQFFEGDMMGNSDFMRLQLSASANMIRRFDTDSIQYIEQELTIHGAPDSHLQLRSTAPGTRAGVVLSPAGSQSISRVDVADLDASAGQVLAPGEPEMSDSVDSGNNHHWFVVEIIDQIFSDQFESSGMQ